MTRVPGQVDPDPHGEARPRCVDGLPGGRGRRLALSLIGVTLLAGCSSEPPPNVLIYVVDTLRADALGAYGKPDAATPHFDRFAREGIVFESAFATASWTRASMASLLTGLYPWKHGAEDRSDRLPAEVETLAQRLRREGYRTGLVTGNPNVGSVFGFESGFDDMLELYARTQPGEVRARELVTPSDAVTRSAVEWLEGSQEPFFLVVFTIDPHAPYTPPRRFDPATLRHRTKANGLFASLRREDLSDTDKSRIRELYQAEVSFNDDSFGALVSALRKQRRYDDTITLVTSDHGEEFWEYGQRGHGSSLADTLLHVPLMIRYPKSRRVPPGGRTDHPISLIDVIPTILELAGLDLPDELDGRSFFSDRRDPDVPLLAGLRLDGRALLSAQTQAWKLVWDVGEDRLALHDLSRESPEAESVEAGANDANGVTRGRLRAHLEASIRSGRREHERAGALPEDVEASLRALGYLE